MPSRDMTPDDILDLVDSLADLPYGGEAVDQRTHALLTAGQAIVAGADAATVTAALLHDIGRARQVANVYPGVPHEEAGRAFCDLWFTAKVGWLVAMHVPAKRWLVSVVPSYLDALSPVSVRSLERQGGPMGEAERAEFESNPWYLDAADLRQWDDRAKDPDRRQPARVAVRPFILAAWRRAEVSA